jgi:hypothetical protein
MMAFGLFHQVHTKENAGLMVKRAKSWAEASYLKLTPSTRAAITGSIAIVRVAAKVATGL